MRGGETMCNFVFTRHGSRGNLLRKGITQGGMHSK
jgi:hypothetical protein